MLALTQIEGVTCLPSGSQGSRVMTDLKSKLEGFETLATECDLIGKLATDKAKREFSITCASACTIANWLDAMRKVITSSKPPHNVPEFPGSNEFGRARRIAEAAIDWLSALDPGH